MAKFKPLDQVRKIGYQEVRTVHEIHGGPQTEATYSIPLGPDFATRIWAKESELELVAAAKKPDDDPGFTQANQSWIDGGPVRN